MNARRTPVLAIAALLLAPATASAQEYSRFTGSFALLNTQPLGELSTGPGFGVAMGGAYALDRARVFHVRADFRAAMYGHENRKVCFNATVGCRILLDLNTSYSTVYLGLGPQLVVPLGPARLALAGTIGLGGFTATSSLSGVDENDDDFGNTTNHEDYTIAWSTGGELRIPLAERLALAVGGHYQRNGVASYLREGGITDNPDGSLTYDLQRTEANMVAITLGVALMPFVDGARR